MSLLSPDNAFALLPGRVILRTGGRLLEESAGEGWDGALDGLVGLLKRIRPRGGLRAVLSQHFSRVLLLPPPPIRLAAAEMDGWVAASLAERYGAEAAGWRGIWQDVPPGRPVPVAVAEAGRLDELLRRCGEAGSRVARIEPWFVAAWNRHHGHLARKSGWFALLEPGRAALARIESGLPLAMRIGHTGAAPLDDLAALVARERLNTTDVTGELWLATAGVAVAPGAAPAGCALRLLSPAGADLSALLA